MSDVVLCERCRYTLSARAPLKHPFSSAQIRSLYLPNDVEASNIASVVEELDHDLSRCDQEISMLKKTLNELKRHRKQLLRSRNEHRSLISSARKLPAEILGEIFDIAYRSDHGLVLKQTTAITVTLSLSQVCSVWRKIVRSTPVLWSHLWLDISHRYSGHEAIPHYLRLSGQAPLTLFVTASRLDTNEPDEESDEEPDDLYETYPHELIDYAWDILEYLLDYSSRWKTVTMRFAWTVFCKIAKVYGNITWTSLEALTLEWRTASGPSATQERNFCLWESPEDLPKLRYLSLPTYRAWFPFPFDQLSSFGPLTGWDSFSNIVQLFQCCHSVEHFTVAPYPGNWSGRLPAVLPSPVQVPIRSLSIEDGTPSKACAFFDSLMADRLISLAIGGEFIGQLDQDQSWSQSLTNFILRSHCSLQNLTLKTFDCVMTTNDLLQFLSLVPTLTHLTVHFNARRTLNDAFFEALTAYSDADSDELITPVILPHLQYMDLHFTDRGYGAFLAPLPTPTTIFTTIESRSPLTSGGLETLKSFKFSLHQYYLHPVEVDWEVDRQSKLRIQALIECGMELSMTVKKIKRPDPMN